jgi:pyruvate decarboxylase
MATATAEVESLKGEVDRLRLEVQSLQAKQGQEKVTLGNYLLTRLTQLGVKVRLHSSPLSLIV